MTTDFSRPVLIAGGGGFIGGHLVRDLADRADDAVESAKVGIDDSDGRTATLAILAQQVFAVLSIMGGSDGRRDSGFYRAPLAHAERLDAMTDCVFRLVDLVKLIGNDDSTS